MILQILGTLPMLESEPAMKVTHPPHTLLETSATASSQVQNMSIVPKNMRVKPPLGNLNPPSLLPTSSISNRAKMSMMKLFMSDPSGLELEDLRGCYVELSKDQNGSRFLQKELEVVDSDIIQIVFEEVSPAICNLMTDVYGNYVVQKFFDFGTDEHRIALARKLHGHVFPLSLHLYGCRVVQKALETFPCNLQVSQFSSCS